MAANLRVLIVSSDPASATNLRAAVRQLGDDLDVAAGVDAALERLRDRRRDLVLIDSPLEGWPAARLISRIRSVSAAAVVVVADPADVDPVEALQAGADDYVSKPVRLAELWARSRAVLRRRSADMVPDESYMVLSDGVIVDFGRNEVVRDATTYRLRETERRLLWELVTHEGRLLSHERLLSEVWGHGWESAVTTLYQHITSLRRKLEHDHSRPRHIINHRGVGYEFRR